MDQANAAGVSRGQSANMPSFLRNQKICELKPPGQPDHLPCNGGPSNFSPWLWNWRTIDASS